MTPSAPPAAPPVDHGDPEAFPHSVASFDPTPSSVLIWTRTERASSVRWTVARDEALSDVVASGEARVRDDRDQTVLVDVEGLEPARTYHYAFEVDGARSVVGRTRTLPEGPTERARLAVVSCANLARDPLTVYRAVAGLDDLDLVLHLGDYIYEDSGEGDDIPVDPPRDLVSLEDYRLRYRQARADTDLQQLHARVPFVAIWDDHDVADNTWDDGAKAHDPEQHGPWEERLAAATTARQEWVPARLRDPDDEGLLWRSVALGDLAEVVLLDARLGGRDEALDSAGGDGELESPDRSMLSEEQWAWAEERITDRSRTWALVGSSVPVSKMHLPMPGQVDLDTGLPEGYTICDGVAICTDQWDGYAAERDRLAEVMGRRGGGTVILSADVHSSWVIDGPFDREGRPVAGELTGSSVSSTTMGGNLGPAASGLGERIGEGMDHVRWVDLDEYGFLVLDVDHERARGEVWAVDPQDRTATARRLTAWSIGPDAGARWAQAADADDHRSGADAGPPRPEVAEVRGPEAIGPPAGGRAPGPGASAGTKLVRAGLVVAAVVAIRPALRAVARGASRARSRR
ncbi:MAG: alkaline phosphatase D family protein [Iamia sp.]